MSESATGGVDIRHQRMADQVADVLQQMIVEHKLEPGRRITQDELAKMLGVSTMPVREALLRLAALGLVEGTPNRPFRVVNSTAADLRDSYWTHAVLTSELARRACLAAGPELAPELQQWLAMYTAAAEEDEAGALEEGYRGFYRTINLAAESPRLLFMLRTNLRFVPERWYPRVPGWIPLSQTAHKAMIFAFERRDPERAATIAKEHIIEAGELLIEYFESIGRWSSPDCR
jgi:DNA-binding GntR family transcriptional regulator